ncbi:hypothetical protein AB0368_38340 [Actinoplanes sp. NPDC051475]|uniref:hypothetical protein n=1 Tax=Actinoplanes sp. NPDC051475 TaxID=3157225 RepID=UPI00344D8901
MRHPRSEAFREARQLKHRAVGATRPFPVHPELVKILLTLENYDIGPGDLLFLGPPGGLLAERAYLEPSTTPAKPRSPLRKRRRRSWTCRTAWGTHASSPLAQRRCLPVQAAEWAGHGVDVLLRVYAKCLTGQDEIDRRRIEVATTKGPAETLDEVTPEPSSTESDDCEDDDQS